MQIIKQTLADIGIVVSLLAIGAIGYRYSPLLLPKSDVVVRPSGFCELQRQPCAAALPEGGGVTLSFSPSPIPMVRPFAVDVRIDGATARKVEVDFAGVSMNMGYNRPELKAVAEGRFTGEASLPVCITGAMTWEATVLIETATRRIAIPFRFDSSSY